MTFSIQSVPSIELPAHLREKEERLRTLMREAGSWLIAYSGGVDSSYLAHIATEELGEKALSVLGISPSVASAQRDAAESLAKKFGFNFQTLETKEFADPNYIANPSNRCYFCKSELFNKLTSLAKQRGIAEVVDGTNADDIGGHRPGRLAADERSVRSPLVEVGMAKKDIRELSRAHGLPTWDQPSSPCLSSRVAYGVPVTIERLGKVEKGEMVLREHGFREFRLRVHGEIARIEISPDEFDFMFDREKIREISDAIRNLGFKYVTLDLEGYRSGALNEALTQATKSNIFLETN
ncbi:MAG: ATP-dependent sacrificial sulfur transferase LarE [Acidobacteriota bacterium]